MQPSGRLTLPFPDSRVYAFGVKLQAEQLLARRRSLSPMPELLVVALACIQRNLCEELIRQGEQSHSLSRPPLLHLVDFNLKPMQQQMTVPDTCRLVAARPTPGIGHWAGSCPLPHPQLRKYPENIGPTLPFPWLLA